LFGLSTSPSALARNDPPLLTKCAFCGYAASADNAAELYIANTIGTSRYYCMKEREEYPLRNLPQL
jgi:hypothetical protein